MVKQERARLLAGLQELHCTTYHSMANYIFFRAEPGLTEACRKKNILIRDCSNYVGLTEGFYRIAVKAPHENTRLLNTLKAALTELRALRQD
jgi:threonine-phosphate decarboxylase